MTLEISGRWFVDASGRRMLLRGVNLGGSAKMPRTPNGATHIPTDFSDHRAVSFVGRPFPLDEADAHYARLRDWGFNVLRFLTTWEAIEHAGPGDYDEAYLDYLRAVIKKAADYGFWVFLDPHQDVWSRMTGGDGAPGWTLELVGFDIPALDRAEAAITHQGRIRSDWRSPYPYEPMIWPNNWGRLASATLFTLFFAGERFAPECCVDGENIQPYLQRHFIGALRAAAERLADFEHVLGYDSLNEPSAGYIGLADLRAPLPVYRSAPQLTGFDALTIPAGFARAVPYLERRGLAQVVTGSVRLNAAGVSAWRAPADDVWRRHGVWEINPDGQPRLLRPDYFAGARFFAEHLAPFAQRYATALRAVDPDAIIFIEGEPGAAEPLHWESNIPVVNASHWYDLLTLTAKHYTPDACLVWGSDATVEGVEAVRDSFREQIAAQVALSREHLGGAPTLIGEFGVPYDLDGGTAFHTGDFGAQEQALDAYYDALDANLVHSAQWNYTADNDNVHGDRWNGEDLSIFSRDRQTPAPGGAELPANDGGRAARGFCRPRVVACAGEPRRQVFEMETGTFTLEIESNPALTAPTIIYVPRIQYPYGARITVSSGHFVYDLLGQQLEWHSAAGGRQKLLLIPIKYRRH